MRLLIDIGNTRVKWVLSDGQQMVSDVTALMHDALAQSNLQSLAQQIERIDIANVAGEVMQTRLMQLIDGVDNKPTVNFVEVTQSACDVHNQYQDISQLGVDRWLSVIAAYAMVQSNCLVVNMGTAVTIDALTVSDASAQFVGGVILPGLHMMQVALHGNTAQLSLTQGNVTAFANNTGDAIISGCVRAIVGAIQLQWQQLATVVKSTPQLILSGGDAERIKNNLPLDLAKHSIIVDNLPLRGLLELGRDVG